MNFQIQRKKDETATPVELDLHVKGDKFLYYKRRFQKLENTVKVFPFWNDLYMWGSATFSIITSYFLLLIIDSSVQKFPEKITLIHLDTIGISLPKVYMYSFFYLPIAILLLNYFISYKIYNRKKYIALLLITCNTLFTLLLMVSIFKNIQMHSALN